MNTVLNNSSSVDILLGINNFCLSTQCLDTYDCLVHLHILAYLSPLNCDIVTFTSTYNTMKAISGLSFSHKV